ncbi:MAG: ATP phosphoribosyltransferase [Tissierellia bacterium]|jgi:ATP phosphoribosyltransferase|nr:ATP phosphoribosyltransferase [Tissierellia bacterium]
MNQLTIALAKGRLADKGLELFKNTDIEIDCDENSRKLVFTDAKEEIRFIFAKPSDIITYVEKGVADLGIVGKDMILEENREVYELMDLGFGKCRFAIAGFENQNINKKNDVLRIATNYPNYVKRVFDAKSQRVEIIKLNGSIELAPVIGLSDLIVDIVETGETLKKNGLVVLEELDSISARLVANKASYRLNFDTIKKIENKLGGN